MNICHSEIMDQKFEIFLILTVNKKIRRDHVVHFIGVHWFGSDGRAYFFTFLFTVKIIKKKLSNDPSVKLKIKPRTLEYIILYIMRSLDQTFKY